MKQFVNIQDKVVLVTGASSGIGAATATLFAEHGAKVAVGYHSNVRGCDAVVHAIQSFGGTAIAVQGDLSNPEEIQTLMDSVATHLGPIDILVNNAGSLIERAPLMEQSVESWDQIMNLNLRSAFMCAQIAGRRMIDKGGGAIVNVGSIAGRNGGGPGQAPIRLLRLASSLSRSRWLRNSLPSASGSIASPPE
jgi:3-oxoacyl-[acyl-carrier protein] reductase